MRTLLSEQKCIPSLHAFMRILIFTHSLEKENCNKADVNNFSLLVASPIKLKKKKTETTNLLHLLRSEKTLFLFSDFVSIKNQQIIVKVNISRKEIHLELPTQRININGLRSESFTMHLIKKNKGKNAWGGGGGKQVSHVIIINEKQFLIQYLVPIKLLISKQYLEIQTQQEGL